MISNNNNQTNIPFAFAVVSNECSDEHENVTLQFDHPEMCGQAYKKAVPLFNHEFNQEELIRYRTALAEARARISKLEKYIVDELLKGKE